MTSTEKELMEEKFKGIIALIEAQEDIRKTRDDAHYAIILETRDLARITNGRVTSLEKREATHFIDCPNATEMKRIKKDLGFFSWFNSPVRVALFFSLIIFVSEVFNNVSLWGVVKKLFSLL